ncbi:hypothetical protein [Variovorax guangxiensis]|uniref:hypothetical protein n=1 Tax=Variovorax guangxiensis TaxID=1775474 RepID=UPI00285A05EB|nr:hypothetical protein [Variovorax guangxiensis]MDR6860190.1 hypothetical protein [Variovorax guangxiensis]
MKYRPRSAETGLLDGLKYASAPPGGITNYNVSPFRSGLHKALPLPFYWTDSGIDRTIGPASKIPAMEDRQHTAYIKLIDGGNAENLGLFALMKRRVKTIVVADSASDKNGTFQDLCAFRHRLQFTPKTFPKYLYLPGLKDFGAHCDDLLAGVERGYPIREWKANFPILVGCMRIEKPKDLSEPCDGLGDDDTRLLVVKPAIHLANFVREQTEDTGAAMTRWRVKDCLLPEATQRSSGTPLLNCETAQFILASWDEEKAGCQTFPQHGTATMTVNSSPALFSAYRELGRQYRVQAKDMLAGLMREEPGAIRLFEKTAEAQGSEQQAMNDRFLADGTTPRPLGCKANDKGPWRQTAAGKAS